MGQIYYTVSWVHLTPTYHHSCCLASSPGPAPKKGVVTYANTPLLAVSAVFVIDQSCSSITNYCIHTQEQAQAVRTFVLGSDVFVMLPTGSGKSLCYASLPYIFDSLRQSAGEKDAHHCIAVVVCPLSSIMLMQ